MLEGSPTRFKVTDVEQLVKADPLFEAFDPKLLLNLEFELTSKHQEMFVINPATAKPGSLIPVIETLDNSKCKISINEFKIGNLSCEGFRDKDPSIHKAFTHDEDGYKICHFGDECWWSNEQVYSKSAIRDTHYILNNAKHKRVIRSNGTVDYGYFLCDLTLANPDWPKHINAKFQDYTLDDITLIVEWHKAGKLYPLSNLISKVTAPFFKMALPSICKVYHIPRPIRNGSSFINVESSYLGEYFINLTLEEILANPNFWEEFIKDPEFAALAVLLAKPTTLEAINIAIATRMLSAK